MAWHEASLVEDGTPKWLQVVGILRKGLESGEFPPGETMPTEAQLNSAFGISRTTARAALNKLVQEGVLMRRSGVGSVVLGPKVDQPVSQIRGFTEDMLLRGLKPSFEVVEAAWARASGEASHALGLPSSDTPFMVERLLKANDRLIGHSVSWVRPDIFGPLEPPDRQYLETASLYAWLRQTLAVTIAGGVEYIEAQVASAETARLLDVAPGTAVLVVTRVARTGEGLPIEFAVVTYRSDRYRFRVEL
jgi:GntR family transcriptional regulator